MRETKTQIFPMQFHPFDCNTHLQYFISKYDSNNSRSIYQTFHFQRNPTEMHTIERKNDFFASFHFMLLRIDILNAENSCNFTAIFAETCKGTKI